MSRSSLILSSVLLTDRLKELLAGRPPRSTFPGSIAFSDQKHPFGQLEGEGLRGRLILDLSQLREHTLKVSNDQFFIRTRYPQRSSPPLNWVIEGRDLSGQMTNLNVRQLNRLSQPCGAHLLECSGNGRHRSFGLMSSADWGGVPIREVLDLLGLGGNSAPVLISGLDDHAAPFGGSVPGASWIFTPEQLERSGAFLVTSMNGEPLSLDHGYPVRLIVPGWYGCCSMKWVNLIQQVDDQAKATSQMMEFASRTHQRGVPSLAVEYQPAEIDVAALPIRLERATAAGGVFYRLTGVVWGGQQQINRMKIRFRPGPESATVEGFEHEPRTWRLWTYDWKPTRSGGYEISLSLIDSSIRTRRLDRGYYTRRIQIPQA